MERFSFGIADLYPCQNTRYNGSSLPPVWMRPACHYQEFASNWMIIFRFIPSLAIEVAVTRPTAATGVVAYWSSHLDGAQSEKVVPSGHPAHQNPQGMEEVDRILRLNLRSES